MSAPEGGQTQNVEDTVEEARVSSVWPPGLNAFESIVIYDRNAQLFQSFLGQLKKNITPNCFFCSI